jgi:hypothetical protein
MQSNAIQCSACMDVCMYVRTYVCVYVCVGKLFYLYNLYMSFRTHMAWAKWNSVNLLSCRTSLWMSVTGFRDPWPQSPRLAPAHPREPATKALSWPTLSTIQVRGGLPGSFSNLSARFLPGSCIRCDYWSQMGQTGSVSIVHWSDTNNMHKILQWSVMMLFALAIWVAGGQNLAPHGDSWDF